MRSIDKLREYVLTAASVNATTRAVLAGYVDEIEREVADNERFRAEAEPFANRLRKAAVERADVTIFGVDYTPLPVDADGVPIHVGDVMNSKVDYLFDGKPFTVRGLVLCEDGWEAADGRFGNRYDTDSLRHHHAPTVEDVLREFAGDIADVLGGDDFKLDGNDELFAEYAAKLRLAEGEDA